MSEREYREALQSMVSVETQDREHFERRGLHVRKDHACSDCTDDPIRAPSIPADWKCAYHAAKALLARPEPEQKIPLVSDEDEAIVREALKRKAWDSPVRISPRVTLEEAEDLLDDYRDLVAGSRAALLKAMGVTE